MNDDYKRAGFELLPSKGGRDKASAFQVFIYAFSLIPAGLIPYFFGITGFVSAIIITLAGIVFTYQSYRLLKDCSMKSATQVMFGSFLYLPVVLLSLLFDKI
jgi:protoheme IX farnesyltransferase